MSETTQLLASINKSLESLSQATNINVLQQQSISHQLNSLMQGGGSPGSLGSTGPMGPASPQQQFGISTQQWQMVQKKVEGIAPPSPPKPPPQPTMMERIAGGFNTAASALNRTGQGWVQEGEAKGGRAGLSMQGVGHGLNALTSKSELHSGAEGIRSVGSALGMIPEVGPVLQGITAFGAAIVDGVDKIKQWNREVFESNMRFAAFSASMAGIKVEQEARDIKLGRERGERRAPSAGRAAEAMNNFEKISSQFEDSIGILKNEIVAKFVPILAETLEIIRNLPFIKDAMDDMLAEQKKKSGETQDYRDYLYEQSELGATWAKNRPLRFR